MISIDNIHKSYLMGKEAVPALRGVSLEIAKGEFVCLMGPSGSGKTTLLNIIGGLDEPSRGHITIDGENLVSMSENNLARLRLNKMGFIFQNYNLLANFTAQENVEAPMVLAKMGLIGDLPACTDLKSKPWVVEAGVRVLDAPFVAHGNVATAGGCLSSHYLAAWMIARGGSLEDMRQAIHYVAPVGEKAAYVERAAAIVKPFLAPRELARAAAND